MRGLLFFVGVFRFNLARTTARLFIVLTLCYSFSIRAQENRDSPNTANLRNKLESLFKTNRIPGAQFVLVNKDSVVFRQNFGYADVKNKVPVQDSTLFRIASISKSFLALGILKLSERKQIDLNDRLKELVPEIAFENPWEEETPLRVVHVLEHTTGFDEVHAHNVSGLGLSTKECLAADVKSRRSRWPPGTYYSYCNSAMPMLAYAIEKKTGKSFEDFMLDEIFEPLGMHTTSYDLTSEVQHRLAKGYSYRDGGETPYRHVLMRASGAVNSNVTEMSQFVRMLLNRGKIGKRDLLSEASISRMETPTTSYTASIGEGYGLANTTTNYKGFLFHGHSGGHAGYLSSYGYVTELNMGFVLLYNTGNQEGNDELLQAIMEFITNHKPVKSQPEVPFDTLALKSFEGYYRMATSRAQVFHFLGRLWGGNQYKIIRRQMMTKPLIGGRFKAMKHGGNNIFYTDNGNGVNLPVVFIKNREGENVALYATGGNNIQTSWVAVMSPFIVVGILIPLILSSLVIGAVRIPYLIIKHKTDKSLILTLFSFVITLLLGTWAAVWIKIGEPFIGVIQRNVWTISFWLLPILISMTIGAGLIYSFIMIGSPVNRLIRIHTWLVLVFCGIVMSYLAYWGVVGFKPWDY